MKKVILLIMPVLMIGLMSCKKEIYGCTDPAATNYSDYATQNDGSCFFMPNVPANNDNVFVSDIALTFSPSASYYYFTPDFGSPIEDGDIVIVEVRSSDWMGGSDFWTPLPYTDSGSPLHIWFEYQKSSGLVYIYTEDKTTGNNPWSGNYNMHFKIALIKKKMAEQNPTVSEMSIEEVCKIQ